MSKRAALYLGTAALTAQIFVFYGCSSSDTSTPAMTGAAGMATTTGAGGSTGGAGGATTFTGPIGAACPSGVKNKGACTTEEPCFNTCGPLKAGIKNCACVNGAWSCPLCEFDPANNYDCYKITPDTAACPPSASDPVNGLPQSGEACDLPLCTPCGSGTSNAYRDSGGIPKIGWCVCSAEGGTGTYSCASTQEWAPQ